ncbi:MAG: hypothetical protein F8N37_13340 [Telmatospirillum sp.]|nr:hypothetical protein [Telmatospirillum sp.]
MPIEGNSNVPANGLNWAMQTNASAVAGSTQAAATAATQRTRKTRTDRAGDFQSLGGLFPMAASGGSIEAGLQASIRDAIGTLNTLFSDESTGEALQSILGRPGDSSSIGQSIRDLASAFARLAANSRESARDAADAAGTFTARLEKITAQIQSLRGQVDSEIGVTVEQANQILNQLAALNARITKDAAAGFPAADVASMRDAALDSLAGSLDIASFRRADGTVSVFTKSGTPLVTATAARLGYRPTPQITADMTIGNGALSGVTADGVDISGQISAGTLHALLKTRDATLPNVQSQLDTLAQSLQTHVNQASNRALAGTGLGDGCKSARHFRPAGGQRFSVAGGDVLVTARKPDGSSAGMDTLTAILRRHGSARGLPETGIWTAGLLAGALDQWLTRCLGPAPAPYVRIDNNGALSFSFQGPAAGTGLSFQDRRSGVCRSSVFPDPDRPLGLTGPVSIVDGAGNLMSTGTGRLAVAPGDSLTAISAKLAVLDGIETTLTARDGGWAITLTSTTGSDMAVLPDPDGATAVRGLGLLPSSDQPAEDVVVNHWTETTGPNLCSAPFPDAITPLGLSQPLEFLDGDGHPVARLTPAPDWSLRDLSDRINDLCPGGELASSVVACGNRAVLKISPAMGRQLGLGGGLGACRTAPREGFQAAGGDLSIMVDGRMAGRITIRPGDGLAAIAQAINDPRAPFAAEGIAAGVTTADGGEMLEISHRWASPLAFGGTIVGSQPGQIDLRLNSRDRLGLYPPVTQIVSGFANFLGLNDIFVAGPLSGVDSKAPIGIFASTAAPGMAGAIRLNPLFRDRPERLSDAALAGAVAEMLQSDVNLAAAGGFPRGSQSLPLYAETIVATAATTARNAETLRVFQQTFLHSLNRQRSGLSCFDIDHTAARLSTYQQAFQDSSFVASTMKQFFGSLGAPMH